MRTRLATALSVPGLVAALAALAAGAALAQTPASVADVQAPRPTVPERFSLQGEYVRVAYNDEGFVTLGYRVANGSVGEEWMLLEAGFTVRAGVKGYTLKREAISMRTPDGKRIPLATQKEYAAAHYLPALVKRAQVTRDNLNYFPVEVNRPCTLLFFSSLGKPKAPLPFDQVELTSNRACLGRLFFRVPGGIRTGQHWLDVKFAQSEVQVPFRILTKDEEKYLRKNWQDLQKALEGEKVD